MRGPSAYARRSMGSTVGYFEGIGCLIEFLFAPPACALAVGKYIHNLVPKIPAIPATVVALLELCIFWGATVPHATLSSFFRPLIENNGFEGFLQYIPGGWIGIMASVPFAIWFFLALEGGAMAAEEMVNPQKDIPKGFITGMLTLFIMMCFTLFLTAGNVITRDMTKGFHVRIVAPLSFRADRISRTHNIKHPDAEKLIIEKDAKRDGFIEEYVKHDNREPLNYHIVVNLGQMTVDEAAAAIVNSMQACGFL